MPSNYVQSLYVSGALTLTSGVLLHASRKRNTTVQIAVTAGAVAVNVAVPLLFDRSTDYVSIATVSFIVTWLSTFKAIALLAGRGPLAQRPWTLPQFLALYLLPIVPKAEASAGAGGRWRDAPGELSPLVLVARWLLKTSLTAGVVFYLQHDPPPPLKELLYVLGIYGMLGCFMDGPASLALGWLRCELEPHFRPPWQAVSVSQFWGRQWNQAASNALRTTIYEPLAEGRWRRGAPPGDGAVDRRGAAGAADTRSRQHRGGQQQRTKQEGEAGVSRGRAAFALCAACCASGLIHEVIMVYVYGGTTGGEWLAFFSLQGPLILAERWLLSTLGGAGIKPPRLLRTALTLCTLLALAHFLFFAPAERMGLPRDFAASMRDAFAWLASPVTSRWGGTR